MSAARPPILRLVYSAGQPVAADETPPSLDGTIARLSARIAVIDALDDDMLDGPLGDELVRLLVRRCTLTARRPAGPPGPAAKR